MTADAVKMINQLMIILSSSHFDPNPLHRVSDASNLAVRFNARSNNSTYLVASATIDKNIFINRRRRDTEFFFLVPCVKTHG